MGLRSNIIFPWNLDFNVAALLPSNFHLLCNDFFLLLFLKKDETLFIYITCIAVVIWRSMWEHTTKLYIYLNRTHIHTRWACNSVFCACCVECAIWSRISWSFQVFVKFIVSEFLNIEMPIKLLTCPISDLLCHCHSHSLINTKILHIFRQCFDK